MRPEDFQTIADLPAEELQDVNFVMYHKWDNTRRHVDALDADEGLLVTSGEGMKSWNAHG